MGVEVCCGPANHKRGMLAGYSRFMKISKRVNVEEFNLGSLYER